PEHDCLLHFVPQKSTAIVEAVTWTVNAKMLGLLDLRLIFALRCMLACADLSCSEPASLDFPLRVRPLSSNCSRALAKPRAHPASRRRTSAPHACPATVSIG